MVVFMVIGVRHYNRILQRWSKYNSLFVLQTVAIFYLAINEFTGRNIHGIFLIYLLTQYCLFLTFCIVLDSNLTDDQITNWQNYNAMIINKVYRLTMHLVTLTLFISSFWMPGCSAQIYPINFVLVTIVVLIHQLYDGYMKSRNYYLDFDNMPPISKDRLRYNRELFKQQTGCLFWANLIFGIVSICCVSTGWLIMNKQNDPEARQHLLCYGGSEWIYLSLTGMCLGTCHQLLILTQINITQFVLVKIPRNMGIFHQDAMHSVSMGLRSKLLTDLDEEIKKESPPAETAINDDDDGFVRPNDAPRQTLSRLAT